MLSEEPELSATATFLLSLLLTVRKRPEAALRVAQDCLGFAAQPQLPGTRMEDQYVASLPCQLLCTVLAKLGQFEDAEREWRNAIRRYPALPIVKSGLASCLAAQGKCRYGHINLPGLQ